MKRKLDKKQFIWKLTKIYEEVYLAEKENLINKRFSKFKNLPKSSTIKYLLVTTGTPDEAKQGSFRKNGIEKYTFDLKDGNKVIVKYHKIHRFAPASSNSKNIPTAQIYIIDARGKEFYLFWNIEDAYQKKILPRFFLIDKKTWKGSDSKIKNWTHIPIEW